MKPAPVVPQGKSKNQDRRRLPGKTQLPAVIVTAPGRSTGTLGGTLIPPTLAWMRTGETESNPRAGTPVVPVVVVVPGAAADDAASSDPVMAGLDPAISGQRGTTSLRHTRGKWPGQAQS